MCPVRERSLHAAEQDASWSLPLTLCAVRFYISRFASRPVAAGVEWGGGESCNPMRVTAVTIVRVGATKKYSDGWETAFSKGKKKAQAAKPKKAAAKKSTKASAKKKPAKKK